MLAQAITKKVKKNNVTIIDAYTEKFRHGIPMISLPAAYEKFQIMFFTDLKDINHLKPPLLVNGSLALVDEISNINPYRGMIIKNKDDDKVYIYLEEMFIQ